MCEFYSVLEFFAMHSQSIHKPEGKESIVEKKILSGKEKYGNMGGKEERKEKNKKRGKPIAVGCRKAMAKRGRGLFVRPLLPREGI